MLWSIFTATVNRISKLIPYKSFFGFGTKCPNTKKLENVREEMFQIFQIKQIYEQEVPILELSRDLYELIASDTSGYINPTREDLLNAEGRLEYLESLNELSGMTKDNYFDYFVDMDKGSDKAKKYVKILNDTIAAACAHSFPLYYRHLKRFVDLMDDFERMNKLFLNLDKRIGLDASVIEEFQPQVQRGDELKKTISAAANLSKQLDDKVVLMFSYTKEYTGKRKEILDDVLKMSQGELVDQVNQVKIFMQELRIWYNKYINSIENMVLSILKSSAMLRSNSQVETLIYSQILRFLNSIYAVEDHKDPAKNFDRLLCISQTMRQVVEPSMDAVRTIVDRVEKTDYGKDEVIDPDTGKKVTGKALNYRRILKNIIRNVVQNPDKFPDPVSEVLEFIEHGKNKRIKLEVDKEDHDQKDFLETYFETLKVNLGNKELNEKLLEQTQACRSYGAESIDALKTKCNHSIVTGKNTFELVTEGEIQRLVDGDTPGCKPYTHVIGDYALLVNNDLCNSETCLEAVMSGSRTFKLGNVAAGDMTRRPLMYKFNDSEMRDVVKTFADIAKDGKGTNVKTLLSKIQNVQDELYKSLQDKMDKSSKIRVSVFAVGRNDDCIMVRHRSGDGADSIRKRAEKLIRALSIPTFTGMFDDAGDLRDDYKTMWKGFVDDYMRSKPASIQCDECQINHDQGKCDGTAGCKWFKDNYECKSDVVKKMYLNKNQMSVILWSSSVLGYWIESGRPNPPLPGLLVNHCVGSGKTAEILGCALMAVMRDPKLHVVILADDKTNSKNFKDDFPTDAYKFHQLNELAQSVTRKPVDTPDSLVGESNGELSEYVGKKKFSGVPLGGKTAYQVLRYKWEPRIIGMSIATLGANVYDSRGRKREKYPSFLNTKDHRILYLVDEAHDLLFTGGDRYVRSYYQNARKFFRDNRDHYAMFYTATPGENISEITNFSMDFLANRDGPNKDIVNEIKSIVSQPYVRNHEVDYIASRYMTLLRGCVDLYQVLGNENVYPKITYMNVNGVSKNPFESEDNMIDYIQNSDMTRDTDSKKKYKDMIANIVSYETPDCVGIKNKFEDVSEELLESLKDSNDEVVQNAKEEIENIKKRNSTKCVDDTRPVLNPDSKSCSDEQTALQRSKGESICKMDPSVKKNRNFTACDIVNVINTRTKSSESLKKYGLSSTKRPGKKSRKPICSIDNPTLFFDKLSDILYKLNNKHIKTKNFSYEMLRLAEDFPDFSDLFIGNSLIKDDPKLGNKTGRTNFVNIIRPMIEKLTSPKIESFLHNVKQQSDSGKHAVVAVDNTFYNIAKILSKKLETSHGYKNSVGMFQDKSVSEIVSHLNDKPGNYYFMTPDFDKDKKSEHDKLMKKAKQVYNHPLNLTGKLLRMFILTGENWLVGINLFQTRFVHILTPLRLKHMFQAIGRAQRLMAMCALPRNERETKIYYYMNSFDFVDHENQNMLDRYKLLNQERKLEPLYASIKDTLTKMQSPKRDEFEKEFFDLGAQKFADFMARFQFVSTMEVMEMLKYIKESEKYNKILKTMIKINNSEILYNDEHRQYGMFGGGLKLFDDVGDVMHTLNDSQNNIVQKMLSYVHDFSDEDIGSVRKSIQSMDIVKSDKDRLLSDNKLKFNI